MAGVNCWSYHTSAVARGWPVRVLGLSWFLFVTWGTEDFWADCCAAVSSRFLLVATHKFVRYALGEKQQS